MVALHGKNAERGFQHLEIFPGRLRGHAALPRVAVGIIPQQENHIRPGFHDCFHVLVCQIASVRTQMEIPGNRDAEGRAFFSLPLRHLHRSRDGFHTPGFHLPCPHE